MVRVLVVALLAGLTGTAGAELNKCRKADGSLIYSDQPCPAGATAERMADDSGFSVLPAPAIPEPTESTAPEQPAVGVVPDYSTSRRQQAAEGCVEDCEASERDGSSAVEGWFDVYPYRPVRPRPTYPGRPDWPDDKPRPTRPPDTKPAPIPRGDGDFKGFPAAGGRRK
ncbi:DUF4124 domain-containing protein [Chitinilyticum litopenaei]|uniref:DUF4124 domain-containing protein n=1 Tax=Chitinilyticum litopenaei TaxID=1121276 RepID=UPI00040A1164|nr:DUF4124 domain-containing protein [Chitinilyticum litopenaei]